MPLPSSRQEASRSRASRPLTPAGRTSEPRASHGGNGLRVLTFLHSFEPGGVERVALRMVRHWRSLGIDAPLFLGREDGAMRSEFAPDIAYEVPAQPRRSQASWETLWMILKLPQVIRRERPDLLFVAGSTYTIVALAMVLLLGRSCPPIVVKISNDLVRRDLNPVARLGWRFWLWLQARCAAGWVVMDEAMLADLPRPMARRGHVVHDPAIDTLSFADPREPAAAGAPRRFVAVGRLAHQKDFGLMLAAFAAGARADERLTIYGEGPERPMLEALAASLGIADRVDLAGHVPDAASRLADYDILLMSSRYEGVPAAVVEALAAGLKVVTTDCGSGLRGLLGQGRFGTIVPRDAAALAEAIRTATVDPAPPAGLYQHLRRFTLERSAQRYLDLFADTVLRQRGARLQALEPEAYA